MSVKSFHEIELEAWSERAIIYDALFASISTQAIDSILDSFGPLLGKRHLDVACGTGHLVAAASRRGASSEGIDFSQAMIAAARANYPGERFNIADATQLPHADGSFDAVSCSFGLSHMENPQSAVKEAFRVLKKGGCFAFTLWYGPDDGSEPFTIIRSALQRYVKTETELPKEWVQLRFADKQVCRAVTLHAGFEPPIFNKLPIVWQTPSAKHVGDIFDKLSVRTKIILERQPPETQQRIHEYILSQAETRRKNGVISLESPALLTIVHKPHEMR